MTAKELAELERLIAEIERLQKIADAAQKLERKLFEVFGSDEYHSVFVMAQIHGAEYTGPECGEELAALQDAFGLHSSVDVHKELG